MDLSDPNQRRDTIVRIFNEELKQLSANFLGAPADVLEPLYGPGEFWAGDLTKVDAEALRQALRAIAAGLAEPTRLRLSVTSTSVAEAKDKSPCHYLWFC